MQETKTRPAITGPITGGKGWPFGASTLDLAALGYTEAEYFLEGTATRYQLAPGAELSRDGHWDAIPAGEAPFRTRMLVYRPTDAARFNGTVVLTWNNVTAGYDLFSAESREFFEGGYALACLTTQKVGVEGLPANHRVSPPGTPSATAPSASPATTTPTTSSPRVRSPSARAAPAMASIPWAGSRFSGS